MHLFIQHSKINILSATGALHIWVGEWKQNVTIFYIYGAVPPRIRPHSLRACPGFTLWSHFVSWSFHPHPQELLPLYLSCLLLCSSDSRVCYFYQPLESILSKLCYPLFFLLEMYNPMNLFAHFFLPTLGYWTLVEESMQLARRVPLDCGHFICVKHCWIDFSRELTFSLFLNFWSFPSLSFELMKFSLIYWTVGALELPWLHLTTSLPSLLWRL